jgi:hypothetical protein
MVRSVHLIYEHISNPLLTEQKRQATLQLHTPEKNEEEEKERKYAINILIRRKDRMDLLLLAV